MLKVDQTVILCVVWLIYFFIHSLTASLVVKEWVVRHLPRLIPAYRMLFNLVALLLLLPPLILIYLWQGPWLWQWSGPFAWLANGLALLAMAGFFWSLKYYDGAEFLGLRQWREQEKRVEDQEHLHISPLHRHVRHPWYALGLVLIWTRDMDAVLLISALLMTLYFVIGYRLEERKLMAYHGDRYRIYRQRVPGLIPLPWRYLTRKEAEQLTASDFSATVDDLL
ncbi:MAG: hypothetical protein RPU64_07035 [Candidatus Sedimenticola sp. (ex Thyasira tokunagai)]